MLVKIEVYDGHNIATVYPFEPNQLLPFFEFSCHNIVNHCSLCDVRDRLTVEVYVIGCYPADRRRHTLETVHHKAGPFLPGSVDVVIDTSGW